MAQWRIAKINNRTKEVTIEHPDGRVLDLTIPKDKLTSSHKNEFIATFIADHEKQKEIEDKKIINRLKSAVSNTPLFIKVILIVETLALLSIVVMRGLH